MYFFKYTASRRAIRNLINQSYSESNDTHNFVYYKNQHFHITIYINTTDVKRSLCKLFKSLKLKKKRESRKLFKLFKLKKMFCLLRFCCGNKRFKGWSLTFNLINLISSMYFSFYYFFSC